MLCYYGPTLQFEGSGMSARRGWDIFWRMNKRSCAFTLLMCAGVVYLSYCFNSCLVTNLNRAIRQVWYVWLLETCLKQDCYIT